jgi:RNA polymerase sigma-70 factor (ECF subfamily)
VGPDSRLDAEVADIYAELHRVAGRYVRRERSPSVQATELVHEAYLRLVADTPARWQNRAHFLAMAAIAMRRLLVERARRRHAAKRGGGQIQVTLDEGLVADSPASTPTDLIALDEALRRLAALDAQQARIVELRYFGGLSIEETGDALGISAATVKRHWTLARAWLRHELEGARPS